MLPIFIYLQSFYNKYTIPKDITQETNKYLMTNRSPTELSVLYNSEILRCSDHHKKNENIKYTIKHNKTTYFCSNYDKKDEDKFVKENEKYITMWNDYKIKNNISPYIADE
jgi:hypothetical protein